MLDLMLKKSYPTDIDNLLQHAEHTYNSVYLFS